jgi:predicted transcriptional regulator
MARSASVEEVREVLRQNYFADVRRVAEDVCQFWDTNPDATRDELVENDGEGW